jgi:hypothetical protein
VPERLRPLGRARAPRVDDCELQVRSSEPMQESHRERRGTPRRHHGQPQRRQGARFEECDERGGAPARAAPGLPGVLRFAACETAAVPEQRRWPVWKCGYLALMSALGVAVLAAVAVAVMLWVTGQTVFP